MMMGSHLVDLDQLIKALAFFGNVLAVEGQDIVFLLQLRGRRHEAGAGECCYSCSD